AARAEPLAERPPVAAAPLARRRARRARDPRWRRGDRRHRPPHGRGPRRRPIAAQERWLVGNDDAGATFARAAESAARLLDDVLRGPHFEEQTDEGATYAEKITPE